MVLRSYLCRKDELILSWRLWTWRVVLCGAPTHLYLFLLLILTVVKESLRFCPSDVARRSLVGSCHWWLKWSCQEPALPSPVTAEERLSPAGPDKGHCPHSSKWQEPRTPAHLQPAFLGQWSASAQQDPTGKGGRNPGVTGGGSLQTETSQRFILGRPQPQSLLPL